MSNHLKATLMTRLSFWVLICGLMLTGSIRLYAADCNSNGIDDLCDISCANPGCSGVPGCGQIPDCDTDGIIDPCELTATVLLEDTFPSSTIDAVKWPTQTSVVTSPNCYTSASYSARFNFVTNATLGSKTLDLSAYDQATIHYWYSGTYSGHNLVVEYWNGSGWQNLATHDYTGANCNTHVESTLYVPVDGMRSDFQVRWRTPTNRYWYLDDVTISGYSLEGGDCNGNGFSDVCEFPNGDCNDNCIPDACDADCGNSGVYGPCTDWVGCGGEDDCDTNQVPDICQLDAGTVAFEDNFNSLPNGTPPSSTLWPEQSNMSSNSTAGVGGTPAARFDYSASAYLTSQELDLTIYQKVTLAYAWRDYNTGHNLIVEYWDGAAWQNIATHASDGSGTWREVSAFELPAGALNDSFKVKFRTPTVTYFYLDNVEITAYAFVSGDCDGNGVMDICQADCDSDGIPNVCDFNPPVEEFADNFNTLPNGDPPLISLWPDQSSMSSNSAAGPDGSPAARFNWSTSAYIASQTFDLSTVVEATLSYSHRSAYAGYTLVSEYWDGSAWQNIDTHDPPLQNNWYDVEYTLPAQALIAGARVKFSTPQGRYYYVDNVVVESISYEGCPSGCDGDGDCFGSTPHCLNPPGGTCVECVNNGHCDDSNECTDDVCDVGGTYTCSNPNNTDPCTDDGNDCTDDICSGGSCTHPDKSVGTACGSPSDTDCDNPDTCDGSGTCQDNYEMSGTACTDDGNECTNDQCDGAGNCAHPNKPNGTTCTDDGNECTNDECQSGSCAHPDKPNGTACTGDGDECTDDECQGGNCMHPNSAPGTPCGDQSDTDCDDPNTCNGAGTCLDNYEISGTTCTTDGNDCTQDICDGAGTCTHPDEPNGTPCGSFVDDDCTNPDTCSWGWCDDNDELPGTPCTDDGNDCTDDECDGSGFCTHPNKSAGAACTDDGNDCTDDECDGSGTCTHPGKPVGTACGDPTDDECTNPDTCDGAGTCDENNEPALTTCTDDGNECTFDECDGAGNCTHPPKTAGTPCGSGSDTDCDNPDTCDGAGACQDNYETVGAACTDDGVECTTDECDGAGLCTHPFKANGTPCTDDLNECTGDECQSGVCTHPDLPIGTSCGDPSDTDCTDPDTCDGAGTCDDNHAFNGTGCTDDGNDCTADHCDGLGTCLHPPVGAGAPCADDGNDCTDDECDGAGTCTHPFKAYGIFCGDWSDDECTDPDTCDGAGTCLPNHETVGTPCTDDGNECTLDICDGLGLCTHSGLLLDGTPCTDDGNECTDDLCSMGTCTHPYKTAGEPCGDPTDDTCTDPDSCDGAGNCEENNAPVGTPCGDGTDNDCTDPDTCDEAGECNSNDEPDGTSCTDDGDPCTSDTCGDGTCLHESIDRLDFETDTATQYMRSTETGTVTMEMHCLDGDLRDSGLVNGVQVRFHYNDAVLSLSDIELGDGQGSPWDGGQEVYFEDIDGDVVWAIILPGPGNCTMQDSVVGTVHLTAIAEGTSTVALLPDAPPEVSQFAACTTDDGYPITAFALDYAIVVDDTDPDLAITLMTPDPAMPGTVYITVTASDDDAGLDGDPVVTVTPNGGGAETATFVDENPAGTFNYTFVVEAGDPCGAATVQASVDDLSGNNATTSDTFTIDADDPTLNIASIVPDPAGLGAVAIAVTASDGCTSLADNPTVEVTPNGGSATPAVFVNELPPGTFNYTFTVTGATPEGAAIVDASVTDAAGNTAVDADTFLIDISGPTIDITAITQDGDNVMLSAAPPVRDAYQGTVNILVTADDGGGAGFAGNPDVDVTDAGSTTLPATFVIESPSGTFQYTYSVVAGTANGTATVDAEVTDLALNTGNAVAEEFIVNHNQITVNVQLEGLANAKTRTVTFVVSDCTGAGSAVTINKAVSFDAFGFGVAYLTGADGIRADLATFDISAKENHVLRRMLSGQSMGGGTPTVQFIAASGTELLAGDFTADNLVDVLDFSVLASNWYTPDTQADVDGNSLTDSADFSAIVANYFVQGDTRSTCDTTQPLTGSRRLTRSVSVQSLSAEAAFAADLTGDGVVDVSDVKAFAKLYDIRLSREAARRLSSLEAAQPQRLTEEEQPATLDALDRDANLSGWRSRR